MKKILLILITCVTFIALQACKKKRKPCSEEPTRLDGGIAIVYFFSIPDNKYLYGASGFPSLFSKDSLQIKDQNGIVYPCDFGPTSDPQNPLIQISNVQISPIMTQNEYNSSLVQEVNKTFYIRYSYHQADTLNFRFKCRKTECDAEFEYLRVYYKGSLVEEQLGYILTTFTIKRP